MLRADEMIQGRRCAVYVRGQAEYLLLQPVDEAELETLDREAEALEQATPAPFLLAAFPVENWNADLSPWDAPPAMGRESFGHGAGGTLAFAEETLIPALCGKYGLPEDVPVLLGGYSLAGLFALWAVSTSGRFSAAAAVSPSVWFPGWMEFAREHPPRARRIYLSLGDREERTRNPILARVGDCIRRQRELLAEQGCACTLEWNRGSHFAEPEKRTAKGFAWLLNSGEGRGDPS